MSVLNFTTTILVDNTPAEVFNAILNVPAWWQGDITGAYKSPGDEFTYRVKDIHYSKQRISEIIPQQKLVWQVIDSRLSTHKNPEEWTGTSIVFDITPIADQTELRFTHIGLVPAFECYGDCSWAWGQLIRESLFSLITTGKGTNVFG